MSTVDIKITTSEAVIRYYASVLERNQQFVSKYITSHFKFLKQVTKEIGAATNIQAYVRCRLATKTHRSTISAIGVIQRSFRHKIAINAMSTKRIESTKSIRSALFSVLATTIQRIFRGYWSRCYIHSYYRRKDYLKSTLTINQAASVAYHSGKAVLEEAECDRTAREYLYTVDKHLKSSGHLISTESVAGIYKHRKYRLLNMVADDTVEDALRARRVVFLLYCYMLQKMLLSRIRKKRKRSYQKLKSPPRVQGPFHPITKTLTKHALAEYQNASILASTRYDEADVFDRSYKKATEHVFGKSTFICGRPRSVIE